MKLFRKLQNLSKTLGLADLDDAEKAAVNGGGQPTMWDDIKWVAGGRFFGGSRSGCYDSMGRRLGSGRCR